MKAFIMLCLLQAGSSGMLHTQGLQQPLEYVPLSNKGLVVLKSGEAIKGKIRNTSSRKGITQVTLELSSGEKKSFKSQEIFEFMVGMNDAVEIQFANERGASVKKLMTRKQPSTVPKDYIIYRNTEIGKGKEVLLQLLNPDFDETF